MCVPGTPGRRARARIKNDRSQAAAQKYNHARALPRPPLHLNSGPPLIASAPEINRSPPNKPEGGHAPALWPVLGACARYAKSANAPRVYEIMIMIKLRRCFRRKLLFLGTVLALSCVEWPLQGDEKSSPRHCIDLTVWLFDCHRHRKRVGSVPPLASSLKRGEICPV